MKHNTLDRTLALAGIFQSAQLVQQIARNGQASGALIEACLETLFKIDSHSVSDVYGGHVTLNLGLKTLQHQLSGNASKQDLEVMRYVVGLLHLANKLSRKPQLLDQIAEGLKKTQSQMDYFSLDHENVIASLGALYQDTISTLQPRIIVQGEPGYLSQQSNANKIRALLLAGIRSAVLWRQCGGNRLQFLFGRKAYLKASEDLSRSL